MPSLSLLPVLGAVCLAASACVTEAGSSADVELSDSADVRTVHSRQPRWGEGEGWVVEAEPRLVIGRLSGPEEEQLVDVSAAARQGDGDIVVADRRIKTVRLFDSSGRFRRTLGSAGSGPGEFQAPDLVGVTSGDTILVWDSQHFRITRFESEGDLASVHSLDMGVMARAIDPPLYPARVEAMSGETLLVRLVKKEGKKSPLPGRERRGSGVLRVAQDLSTVDILAFFPGPF